MLGPQGAHFCDLAPMDAPCPVLTWRTSEFPSRARPWTASPCDSLWPLLTCRPLTWGGDWGAKSGQVWERVLTPEALQASIPGPGASGLKS